MIPKYRAWYLKMKIMCEVVDIDFLNEQVSCKVASIHNDIITWDFYMTVLMQSTGLKDVEDKEVFEGDIVQCWYDKGLVEKYKGSWVIRRYKNDREPFGTLYEYIDEAIVIGNVHEHPELLA